MILDLPNEQIMVITSSFSDTPKNTSEFHKKVRNHQQILCIINDADLSVRLHSIKKRLTPERISLLYFKLLKTIKLDQKEPNFFRFQYR